MTKTDVVAQPAPQPPIAPAQLGGSGIVVSPSQLDFFVGDGESDSAPVTLTNTDSSPVTFEAYITNYGGNSPPPVLTGGPDLYGYTFADSDEAGGPAVNFRDISGVGDPISFSDADDGSALLDLPFPFPFYGDVHTSIYVSTNGFMSFGSEFGSFGGFLNDPIPDASTPNGIIAPYWDDLHQRDGDGYTFQLGDGRFVIQWTNFGRLTPSTGEDHNFQVLLSPDGTIEFQYGAITTTVETSHTVGIESSDNLDGLQVYFNEPGAVSDYAVRFRSPYLWASVTPNSGEIAGFASTDILVTVDARDLPEGTYQADLYVSPTGGGAGASLNHSIVPITMTVSDDGVASILIEGERGPRYLGSPVQGLTIDDLAEMNLVRGVPGYFPFSETNLWTSYDNSTGQWVASTGTGEELRNGQAFRWYFLDRDGVGDPNVSVSRALPFLIESDLPANTRDARITLDTSGPRFNHLANPFDGNLYIGGFRSWQGSNGIKSRRLYTYNVDDSAWQVAPDVIGPWEAFRFRAKRPRPNGNDRNLTIPYSAVLVDTPPPAQPDERTVAPSELTFTLSTISETGRPLSDRSLVVEFDATSSAAFDEDEDMEKFQPPARSYALIGARAGGVFATHDVRPFAAAEIPLAIEAVGTRAEMTLSWDADALPAGLPVVLVDLATGDVVDVRTRDSYSFRAATRQAHDAAPLNDLADGGQATDRFVLRIGEAMAAAADVTELALDAPAPNPSAGTARIGFAMPEAGAARVAVYDVRGRQVAVLADGEVAAGRHEATLDGGALAAGVYVVRLEALGQVLVRQAVVVR